MNDLLYVTTRNTATDEEEDQIVVLASQVYTGSDLAAELEAQLNAVSPIPSGFSVSYDFSKHVVIISTSSFDLEFEIMTVKDLATKKNGLWSGPSYDPRNPADVNSEMLGQTEGTAANHGLGNPWVSAVLNLQPIRTIFVHSPNLGNFNTVGPNGERGIIKSIPVTSGPGTLIVDQGLNGNDFLDCSRQTLRALSFQLKDVHGNLINLHGGHVSFSLIFDIGERNS